jgi:Reverse transcriptase (RNA-dependent DNA polymerase)
LNTDSSWLGIDTFSTYCMTNDMNDFDGKPTAIHKTATGVLGSSKKAIISYYGPGTFYIMDDAGEICPIQMTELYFCDTVPYRLISPHHLDTMWRQYKQGEFTSTTNNNGTLLTWVDKFGSKHTKTIKHTNKSHVPLCYAAPDYQGYKNFLQSYQDTDDAQMCSCIAECNQNQDQDFICTIINDSKSSDYENFEQIDVPVNDSTEDSEDDNRIISEKLQCHYQLGHLPFNVINKLATTGQLPKRLTKVRDPKCASCMYGLATRRPWRTKATPTAIHMTEISKPGDCVSVDQMISPVPGLVAQTKGYPTKDRYNAATIFVDHYSDITYCHLQTTTNAQDTIGAKEAFERFCKSNGVAVRHYHADNGRFAETAFMAHVAQQGQTISFCGVNAHFQNGKAERRIRTLQDLARTQLLHAMRKWPVAITSHLWPYAILNVVNILNDTSHKDNTMTRIERFSGSMVQPNIKHHHHIGVPVYVLDNELQSGRKIPKWLPRARVGIYLGKSPRHARNVSMVLNPRTGMTSAQYHIKFDDTFETVANMNESSHGWWLQKCGFNKNNYHTPLSDFGSTNTNKQGEMDENTHINDTTTHDNGEVTIDPMAYTTPIEQNDNSTNEVTEEVSISEGAEMTSPMSQPTRKSGRAWKPTTRILESISQQDMALPMCMQAAVYDTEYETIIDDINPMSLLSQTDADTMYWDQAIKQPDADAFIEAAIKEITTHQENGHWKLVTRQDVPPGQKVLDSVWSMKRKRRVKTNEVYKHKARLNVHGGQQEFGLNYWETYAPVVTWAAIRMVLILVLIYGWHTIQIDFILAYPQADVECDIYMQIPKGFAIDGKTRKTHVLQLIKNLYGQKQAGRVWNQHLHNKLLELGWEQSKADECLYYHGDVLFIVYVDDGILVSPNKSNIETQLSCLQKYFNISVEGDLADYVGVNIEKLDNNTINMTQPNIINSILKEMNFMENTKPSATPATGGTIIKDGDEPHKADWHYRRIIGKLNFLASSCRPELSCIVHQCARYSANPKSNHTEAVKSIARYLKGSIDKGIIMKPTNNNFKVYVDADFGGLWDKEMAPDHPITSKSRTGYVVTYANCPIIWASQLQSEIALSTTEAEYLALSTALRHTIPIMRLVKELARKFHLPLETKPTIYCTVFEDNAGAVELANVPKMRPRTRHINPKYHHFRKYVFEGKIKVLYIPTGEQQADIMTKNLPRDSFIKHRMSINGW